MIKATLTYSVLFFLFFSSLLTAQNPLWRGIVQKNSYDTILQTCRFVENGSLRIAPNVADAPKYQTRFRFLDSICISQNFSLEIKLKNNTAIGGQNNFGSEVSFFSNGLKTGFQIGSDTEGGASRVLRVADSIVAQGSSFLTADLTDWRVFRMRIFNDTFSFFIDNNLVFKTKYTRKICNIDILDIAFEGSGAVDELKFYDNLENLIFTETFNDCNNLTRGIKCDPAVPISVKMTPSCLGDTLTLCANFPAMSYLWSSPFGEKVSAPCYSIPNLSPEKTGIYDLTAVVNQCFVYINPIDIKVYPKLQTQKEVSLCVGQTLRLSTGRLVDKAGTYRDTLKTVLGCDSVVTYIVKFGNEQREERTLKACGGACVKLPSGKEVCAAGVYADTVRDASGCLTFYTIKYENTTKVEKNLYFEECEGESVVLPKGMTVRTGGIFRDTFATTKGCDSIVISTVTFKKPATQNLSVKICEGKTYTLPSGKVVNEAGFYRETLKASNGCDSFLVITLTIVKPEPPTISGLEKKEFTEGEQITLSTTATPQYQYQWTMKNEPLGSGNTLNLIVQAGETKLKLTARSNDGCESMTEITFSGVPKLEIPTAFSPNGDATNDYFSIVAKAEGYYLVETLEIFNRSGQVVFNKANESRGWDGTKDGAECPSDVYIYRITVKSRTGISQKFQGEVVLVR